MMGELAVGIRFLTGRAHLHAWGTHVNQGRVEWPPGPWRLLRALVAVAAKQTTRIPDWDYFAPLEQRPRRKAESQASPPSGYTPLPDNWAGDLSGGDQIPLSKLSRLLLGLAVPPEIWTPLATIGQTRHFFPIIKEGVEKNSGTPIIDAFVTLSPDVPVIFYWSDCSLDNFGLDSLAKLLACLPYLGRAESWCEARLLPANEMQAIRDAEGKTYWCCLPWNPNNQPGWKPPNGWATRSCGVNHGQEAQEHRHYFVTKRLSPVIPEAAMAESARKLLPLELEKGNRVTPRKGLALALTNESTENLLLRGLLRDTGVDADLGLDRPVASRWLKYAVPKGVFDRPVTHVVKPHKRRETIHVCRYALNTASTHRPVLPMITDTLPVAERFRAALQALHGGPSANLSGHLENGDRVTGHQHAFFWPEDTDHDGFIDHVTIYCRAGFEPSETDALRQLVRLRQRGGRPDLLVTPVWLAPEEAVWPHERTARVFVSATPYFCPVYQGHGRRGGNKVRPLTQILFDGLRGQNLVPDNVTIKVHEHVYSSGDGLYTKEPEEPCQPGSMRGVLVANNQRFIRCLSFVSKRKSPPPGYGRMLRIEFSEPVCARPFALGHSSHFGLGQFVAVSETREG